MMDMVVVAVAVVVVAIEDDEEEKDGGGDEVNGAGLLRNGTSRGRNWTLIPWLLIDHKKGHRPRLHALNLTYGGHCIESIT